MALTITTSGENMALYAYHFQNWAVKASTRCVYLI
jgi:hypothetical protein